MKKFLKENSLSIVLLSLFAIFLVALAITGFKYQNEELAAHQQPSISFTAYLTSGNFIEAVFENWESEFLQMGALVLLTIWFVQKGSSDSKKLKGKEAVDTSSRYSILRARSWETRGKAAKELLYANSLTIALFTLFFVSLFLHGVGGVAAVNEEAALHNQPAISLGEYMLSAQFWFESFQNWQSEFLAVGVLMILSIFLRQRGSPESKPVGAKNHTTGS